MSFYREYQPVGALTQFIKCYWIFESKGDVLSEEIITHNGCLNIVFTIDGTIKEHGLNYSRQVPDNFIFPISSSPVKFSYKKLKCTGISLQPWANHFLFKSSLARNGFGTLDAAKCFDHLVTIKDKLKLSHIASANEQIVKVAEEFCLSLIKFHRLTDEPFKDIIHKILEVNGDLSVDTICDTLRLTKRGVELKFQRNVGTSPKFFLQRIRFHNFLKEALSKQDTDLTQLALSTGYYDQSHLIKTSKKFTGLPPSRLIPLINTSNGLSKKINFSL